MNDLPDDIYDDVIVAIDERSEIYERYSKILDTQRIAVRANDLQLVSHLANQIDEIIDQLQLNWPLVERVKTYLQNPAVDGRRVQTVRDRLTIVSAKAALAQAGIRELTERLTIQRDAVAAELRAEYNDLHANNGVYGTHTGAADSASLIDATG